MLINYLLKLNCNCCTEKRTNKRILDELQKKTQTPCPNYQNKNDLLWTETICRCNLVKTCIFGMMSGKRRMWCPKMQYIDNIKKWTGDSLEENIRVTEDRTAWRKRGCVAGAANIRTAAAD